MARTPGHLRDLHARLPENCRLLRTDLIRLERFWKKYFNLRFRGLSTETDLSLEWWLIDKSLEDKNLAKYYVDTLCNKSQGNAQGEYGWFRENGYLVIEVEKPGISSYGLRATLFGTEMWVNASTLTESDELAVAFSPMDRDVLTEQLTYHLLTKMPPYLVSDRPTWLPKFIYTFPLGKGKTDGLIRKLRTAKSGDKDYYKTGRGFLSALNAKCREMGIPFDKEIADFKISNQ